MILPGPACRHTPPAVDRAGIRKFFRKPSLYPLSYGGEGGANKDSLNSP